MTEIHMLTEDPTWRPAPRTQRGDPPGETRWGPGQGRAASGTRRMDGCSASAPVCGGVTAAWMGGARGDCSCPVTDGLAALGCPVSF